MPIELHLVWNEAKNECVGFLDEADAAYTSTGVQTDFWTPAAGDSFRELYAKEAPLPRTSVFLDPAPSQSADA